MERYMGVEPHVNLDGLPRTAPQKVVWLARPQLPSREGQLLAPRGREVVV